MTNEIVLVAVMAGLMFATFGLAGYLVFGDHRAERRLARMEVIEGEVLGAEVVRIDGPAIWRNHPYEATVAELGDPADVITVLPMPRWL